VLVDRPIVVRSDIQGGHGKMRFSDLRARRGGADGMPAMGRWLLRGAGASPSVLRSRKAALLATAAGALCLSAVAAEAETWSPAPGSSDWNTGTNWVEGSVPSDQAMFGSSNTTTLTFSQIVTSINALAFNPGAPAYTFDLTGRQLNINGLGIINNSSNAPTFSVNAER
jgi:hypothetical protein